MEATDYQQVIGAALPPLRSLRDPSESADSSPLEVGIRIEIGERSPAKHQAKTAFEVHEISGDVLRLAPEVEEIPWAPRKIAFQPKPPRVRPDTTTAGESREWGIQTRRSYRWMILGGLLVTLSVTAGLALQPLLNKPTSKGGQIHATWVEPEEMIDGIDVLNELILKQPEAEVIFSKFIKAADPADVMPWIRDPLAIEPVMRKHPRIWTVEPDWSPSKDCTWSVFDSEGLPCATLDGSLPGFLGFSACFVVEKNQLLLDWKATVGYGTASFDDLSRGTGDATEIRGWLQPTTYYTAVFPEADFAAFQLLPPRSSEESPIWCYARRNSVEAEALNRLFPGGEILKPEKTPQKVTLMLQRGDPASAPNQWLVVKLLHKQWISP